MTRLAATLFPSIVFCFIGFSSVFVFSDFRQSIIIAQAMCALDLYRFRLSRVQHVESVCRVSDSSLL